MVLLLLVVQIEISRAPPVPAFHFLYSSTGRCGTETSVTLSLTFHQI